MPIFKVSEDLLKISRELIRIPVTVLGDCPQCGGSEIRTGTCEDCGWISEEVEEAIQAWQASQGLSDIQVKRQQEAQAKAREGLGLPPMAASTFVDAFPQFTAYYTQKNEQKCPNPKCGRGGFDLKCEGCGETRPPADLDIETKPFTGIDYSRVEQGRRINIKPTWEVLKALKEKVPKKTKTKTQPKKSSIVWALQEKSPAPPNFDNVTTVETDPMSEVEEAKRYLLQEDFLNSANGSDAQTTEE